MSESACNSFSNRDFSAATSTSLFLDCSESPTSSTKLGIATLWRTRTAESENNAFTIWVRSSGEMDGTDGPIRVAITRGFEIGVDELIAERSCAADSSDREESFASAGLKVVGTVNRATIRLRLFLGICKMRGATRQNRRMRYRHEPYGNIDFCHIQRLFGWG